MESTGILFRFFLTKSLLTSHFLLTNIYVYPVFWQTSFLSLQIFWAYIPDITKRSKFFYSFELFSSTVLKIPRKYIIQQNVGKKSSERENGNIDSITKELYNFQTFRLLFENSIKIPYFEGSITCYISEKKVIFKFKVIHV